MPAQGRHELETYNKTEYAPQHCRQEKLPGYPAQVCNAQLQRYGKQYDDHQGQEDPDGASHTEHGSTTSGSRGEPEEALPRWAAELRRQAQREGKYKYGHGVAAQYVRFPNNTL